MSFGKLLQDLRIKKGLKQREIADYIGLSEKMVSHFENDRRLPDMEIIEKLSKLFKVPVGYWYGEEINEEKLRDCRTYRLLKYLNSKDLIKDIDDIDKETLDLLIESIKEDLQEIKKA